MKHSILNVKIISSTSIDKLNYPIVLLRGLGRSMSFWMEFQNDLGKHFDIILIDLLGTGGSKSFLGRRSITRFAEDVLFTLRHYNIFQFHLAGISMGGMVALEMTSLLGKNIWNSFAIKSIIVMSSSSAGAKLKRIYFKPLLNIFISLVVSVFSGKLSHKYFAKYLIVNEHLLLNNYISDKWDTIWYSEYFSRIALLRQLFAASLYKVKFNKKYLQYHYLFLVSQQDALVPWINTVYLWQNTPFSELIVLNELGHDLTTDDPKKIAHILFNFSKKFDSYLEFP